MNVKKTIIQTLPTYFFLFLQILTHLLSCNIMIFQLRINWTTVGYLVVARSGSCRLPAGGSPRPSIAPKRRRVAEGLIEWIGNAWLKESGGACAADAARAPDTPWPTESSGPDLPTPRLDRPGPAPEIFRWGLSRSISHKPFHI